MSNGRSLLGPLSNLIPQTYARTLRACSITTRALRRWTWVVVGRSVARARCTIVDVVARIYECNSVGADYEGRAMRTVDAWDDLDSLDEAASVTVRGRSDRAKECGSSVASGGESVSGANARREDCRLRLTVATFLHPPTYGYAAPAQDLE